MFNKSFLSLFFACMLTIACTPDYDCCIPSVIHVDPDPVTMGGAANATVDVTLICPIAWTLQDLPDWLTASPASSPTGTGALGAPVTFTAQVNTGASRSATLTFEAANGDKATVTITQNPRKTFDVTQTLTGATSTEPITSTITEGDDFTATYTPESGFALPVTLTVTMGGVLLVDPTDYTFNSGTGELTVPKVSGDLAITAGCGLATYTIAYNKNTTETVTDLPADQTKTHGEALTLSSATPTRVGYNFTKWNTAYDGSGTDYDPSGSYTINDNVTLYAQWELIIYTVTYNSNGTGVSNMPTPLAQTKAHGQTFYVDPAPPTREGYNFTKWNTASDGSGTDYAPGGSYTGNSDVTLYAQWSLITYTLTIAHVTGQTDSYGTVAITAGNPTDNPTGASVTVKATPAGTCTFIKWVATDDRGATAVQDGATDAGETYTFTITANTTLYAVFQGSGSAAAPIEITTVAQLNNVRSNLSWNYILMADLNLNVAPYNTDPGWEPIGVTFTGVFDGNGHTISNLFIDRTSINVGLFEQLTGTVKNLHVEINSIDGLNQTGGIVGTVSSTGKIEHCSVTGGSISGNNNVGGVAGRNDGSISNCYTTGAVSSVGSNVGGVVGRNGGSISNCYTTGAVSSVGSNVGGVVGLNAITGSISNCVALSATVKATGGTGRVVGGNSGTLINNYAHSSMGTDGGAAFPIGSGLGHVNGDDCVATPAAAWWTAEGRWDVSGSNTAWDFTTIWSVTSGSLPVLR